MDNQIKEGRFRDYDSLRALRSEYDNYAGDFYQEYLATGREPMTFEQFLVTKLNAAQTSDDEHTRQACSYYAHYLVYYNHDVQGEKLEHAAFHHAEKQCEIWQTRISKWMDDHPTGKIPEYLERQTKFWERKVAA